MQLVYFIDIFEGSYKIERDRFATDSVNVIKNRPLAAKETQGNFNTYQPAEPQPHQKTMESCIRNNNTQNFRKPYWFVRNC